MGQRFLGTAACHVDWSLCLAQYQCLCSLVLQGQPSIVNLLGHQTFCKTIPKGRVELAGGEHALCISAAASGS